MFHLIFRESRYHNGRGETAYPDPRAEETEADKRWDKRRSLDLGTSGARLDDEFPAPAKYLGVEGSSGETGEGALLNCVALPSTDQLRCADSGDNAELECPTVNCGDLETGEDSSGSEELLSCGAPPSIDHLKLVKIRFNHK